MLDRLIVLDPASALTLQGQIRQRIIDNILAGTFARGRRLPSSRALARQLGVGRNTVLHAMNQLIAEGHLVARERSGIYVNEHALAGRVGRGGAIGPRPAVGGSTLWARKLRTLLPPRAEFRCPPNWQLHPYPFIDGRFDASLFPVAEWREASRLTLGARAIQEWSADRGMVDDPQLIEELRTKVLPRRGIEARPEEILVTLGAQQGLSLVTQLLLDATTAIAVEEPGYPQMRELCALRGARVLPQPIDDEGLLIDRALDEARVVHVTPSHQFPTGTTMSMRRRKSLLRRAKARDFVIIEDDFECETTYLDRSFPALRSLDRTGRVVYVASLSKVLSPALRIGFVVADPELISAARTLRSLQARQPPANNQRAAALFISLGHYDATMRRLARVFAERRTALLDALNHYMRSSLVVAPVRGGTTCWVKGPDHLDVNYLAAQAAQHGILIEPVAHYYAGAEVPHNVFRLGVTSLPVERIREGVARLQALMRSLSRDAVEHLEGTRGRRLGAGDLAQTIAGATLLSRTVYGDPCTVEIRGDGQLVGRAGFQDEDCDEGEWWVENGLFCRRWRSWCYGEVGRYIPVIDGTQIKWFNPEGRLIDAVAIRLRA